MGSLILPFGEKGTRGARRARENEMIELAALNVGYTTHPAQTLSAPTRTSNA